MPFAEINGIRYHYESSGSGDPVVLITGLEGDVGFWDGTVPLLDSMFRVITVDNRGAGSTEYNGDFTIEDLADDVAGLVRHLGVGPAHILGWSMGSHIALAFAAKYPELTRTLTLVSSYLKRPSRSSYILNILAEEYVGGRISETAVGAVMNVLLRTEDFFRHAEKNNRAVRTAAIPDRIGMLRQIRAVDSFDFAEFAHRIRVPTLSIHGLDDIMTPPACGDELADEIADCKRLRIPGEGHILRPERYIPDFIGFISS